MTTANVRIFVSRKWAHGAHFEAFANSAEVGASMSLEDFILAIIEEAGSVGVFTTKAALIEKLNAAADPVLREMKSHTSKVV
jgi:hypothetical protein